LYLHLKSLHDHQTANTHNRAANENNDNNNVNLRPPPTLEQVLIMQAQMLQTMQQTCSKHHNMNQRNSSSHVKNLESFNGPNL
jgi:hypothetical protein